MPAGRLDWLIASAELYDVEADAWTAIADMAVARVVPQGAVLPSGGVLVLSVDSSVGQGRVSAEVLNPADFTWTSTGEVLGTHSGGMVALSDGRVMYAGGFLSDRVEIYDPGSNKWSSVSSMKEARNPVLVLLQSGRVMAAGGTRNVPLVDAELFDPAGNVWSSAADVGHDPRQGRALRLPDGRVFVNGGLDASGRQVTTTKIFQ